jgi:hypothetical protein
MGLILEINFYRRLFQEVKFYMAKENTTKSEYPHKRI